MLALKVLGVNYPTLLNVEETIDFTVYCTFAPMALFLFLSVLAWHT
jgi:hypothetical protein